MYAIIELFSRMVLMCVERHFNAHYCVAGIQMQLLGAALKATVRYETKEESARKCSTGIRQTKPRKDEPASWNMPSAVRFKPHGENRSFIVESKERDDRERLDEILQSIVRQDGGMAAIIEAVEDKGYVVEPNRLPQREYRNPILVTLTEMGGRGEARDVYTEVERKLRPRLSKYDYTVVCTNERPRWEDSTHWERRAMREEGLIASGSPHGIWELTSKGIEAAQNLDNKP